MSMIRCECDEEIDIASMNCRGDRASGKTTLFKRLQGEKFSEEYEQSEEISVSAIQWNHKATDDIVKGLVTINTTTTTTQLGKRFAGDQ